MGAARLGFSERQFSIQKRDILLIPDVVLGAGEAMRRREFIAFVGCTAAAWALPARAQQSAMPVIGFLNSASPQPFAKYVAGFRTGLKETGYIDGQNVTIEFRWAEGHYDRLPEMAADLVRRKRPPCGGAANQRDEFPSPHGFACAEDFVGYKKISHFGSRIVPFVTPKRSDLRSTLGQKRTLRHIRAMSALPPKADIG